MTRCNLAKFGLAALVLAATSLPAQAGLVTGFGGSFGQNTLTITLESLGGPPGDNGLAVTISNFNGSFNANENTITTVPGGTTPLNPANNAFIGSPVSGGGTFVVQYFMSGSSIEFDPPQTGTSLDVYYGVSGDASFSFILSDGSVTILPGIGQFANLEGIITLNSQNAGVTDDYSAFDNFGGTLSYTLDAASGTTSADGYNLQQFFANATLGDTFVLTAAYTATAPAPTIVPEPASMALLGIGTLTSLGLFHRRRKVA